MINETGAARGDSEVRLVDIATDTGVSVGAVSRILRGDEQIKVSQQTRDKVWEAARRLGYQPNPFAAALRGKRTGLIGALSPNLAGTFLGRLMMELQHAARRCGVDLLIGTPEITSEQIEGQLRKLQRLLFDGLMLLGDVMNYQATIRRLQVLRKPYVSVCAGMHLPAPMVNVNDTLGIRLGLDYLHHLGHRRIAFLHSPQWSQEVERSRIFQETLAAFGLTMPPAYLATMQDVAYDPAAPNFQEMWTVQPLRAAQALLQLPERPTAIFCANDGFALACLKGARQLGVRVPDDLSILGYNDELTATLYYPELTTIHQPLDRIAEVALDMLLKMIEAGENGGAAGERILVDPALVVRETCAVPPASR